MIRSGDTVNISSDKAKVERLQQNHGGWNDELEKLLNKPVLIEFFDGNGDIVAVYCKKGKSIRINPKCTTKAKTVQCRDGTTAKVGSTVEVTVSWEELQTLPKDQFGERKDRMGILKGLKGRFLTVKAIECWGYVEANNPQCVIKAVLGDNEIWLDPLEVTEQTTNTIDVLRKLQEKSMIK